MKLNVKFEKFTEVPKGIPAVKASEAAVDLAGAAASSLITHLQGAMEQQKAVLARELHDELGGLLVGAVMDVAWAEQHVDAPRNELRQKLSRARQTLSAAIDLKRKLIEDLRPTLLDNVGLFAALRWHVQATCKSAALTCEIHVPEEEPRFLPNIPIALFRIVQEALAIVIVRRPIASVDFMATVDERAMAIQISSDAPMDAAADARTHSLAAVEQRVAAMGGVFKSGASPTGGSCVTASFAIGSTVQPGSVHPGNL